MAFTLGTSHCHPTATVMPAYLSSEKQYKDKFKQWGLAKNISDRDYQKMLQITKRRKLQKDKETSFCIRDKRVPQGKLDRYSKRKGITENDISSPQPGKSSGPL